MGNYDTTFAKAACAALAFHKSLIGLSQLNALENAASKSKDTHFLESRAVFTYYVTYHLFTACMLIVPDTYLKTPLHAPEKYGMVTEEEINNPSETPEQWEDCKSNEMDWATKIQHYHIKGFCAKVRESNQAEFSTQAPYLIPLYKYFIDPSGSESTCIPGLYEKLCYVRDRVIYRPSYVLTQSRSIIQTSAQLHKELVSLPNSKYLYHAISEVYVGLIRAMNTERNCKNTLHPCTSMLTEMWYGTVQDNLDELCALGHNRRRLQYLGTKDPDNGMYAFPTYICHLLELENIDFIQKYRRKYWYPFEKLYVEDLKAWRIHKQSQ